MSINAFFGFMDTILAALFILAIIMIFVYEYQANKIKK